MKTSPRLTELTARLQALETAIAEVRTDIAVERERIREGLEANIIARLDAGMTVRDIAKAVDCSEPETTRIISVWRKRERVTVRRGRTLPERRKTTDG